MKILRKDAADQYFWFPGCLIKLSDGTRILSSTDVTVSVSKNGGAFAAITGSFAVDATTGLIKVSLSQADTNADELEYIAVHAAAVGPITKSFSTWVTTALDGIAISHAVLVHGTYGLSQLRSRIDLNYGVVTDISHGNAALKAALNTANGSLSDATNGLTAIKTRTNDIHGVVDHATYGNSQIKTAVDSKASQTSVTDTYNIVNSATHGNSALLLAIKKSGPILHSTLVTVVSATRVNLQTDLVDTDFTGCMAVIRPVAWTGDFRLVRITSMTGLDANYTTLNGDYTVATGNVMDIYPPWFGSDDRTFAINRSDFVIFRTAVLTVVSPTEIDVNPDVGSSTDLTGYYAIIRGASNNFRLIKITSMNGSNWVYETIKGTYTVTAGDTIEMLPPLDLGGGGEFDPEGLLTQAYFDSVITSAPATVDANLVSMAPQFDYAIHGSVASSPTVNGFIGDSSMEPIASFYVKAGLVFTSGTLKGIVRKITAYTSGRQFTFGEALPVAPAISDTYDIVGRLE